jgi:hypothetical protein
VDPSLDDAIAAVPALPPPTATYMFPFHASLRHRDWKTLLNAAYVHPDLPSTANVRIIFWAPGIDSFTPPAIQPDPSQIIERISDIAGETPVVTCVQFIPLSDAIMPLLPPDTLPPANHVYPFHATVRPVAIVELAEFVTGVHVTPLDEYAIDTVDPAPTATHNLPFHATSSAPILPTIGVVPNGICAGELTFQFIPLFEYAN